MTTVFNNIDRVAGDPYAAVHVTVELSWDSTVSSLATVASNDTVIRGVYGSSTDDNGHWEVDLVPNVDILPTGSLYKVTERISATDDAQVYFVEVPDGATPPVVWVGDILQDAPVWEA